MSDIQPTESEHVQEQTALEVVLRKALAGLSSNLTTVIYALAGILAIAAIVVYLQRKPAGNPDASQLLLVASSPEEYQDVADSTPTSLLGMLSRLRQGDRLLDNAVTNMFMNREVGLEELASTKAAYENLGSQSGLPDFLRERVLIGMAKVAECECDGTPDSIAAAKAAWQQVIGAFPESIMKEHAESRIARLDEPEAAEFYKGFSTLDPKPMLPGAGGSVPEIPDGLLPNGFPGAGGMPEQVEIEKPEAGDEETGGEELEKPEEEAAAETESPKSTEEPADESAKTEAPKADKPVEAVKEATEETTKTAAPEETSEQAVQDGAKSEPETAKSDGDN